MSVSIKKTGIVQASGEIGANIMPNSYIMQLGTSNVTTGTWRLAGSNTMTRSRVLIGNGMYGFQNSGIQTTPSGGYDDGSCYGIDSFPTEANTDYVISLWARLTDGTEGYAGFNAYNMTVTGGTHTKHERNYYVTPLTKSWQRIWLSMKTNSATTRSIFIGITTGDMSVTTQMCLVKLEKGTVPTSWTPCSTDTDFVSSTSGFNELFGGNASISTGYINSIDFIEI